jgi:protein-tyrosine phosphatase
MLGGRSGGFGKPTQKTAEIFLRNDLGHMIASDAHNSTTRPPRIAEAVEIASKIVGESEAEAMVSTVPAAILADEHVPELREPAWPLKSGKLHFLFG